MRPRTHALGLAAAAIWLLGACVAGEPLGLEVEVRSEVPLRAIEVHARRLGHDGRARVERFLLDVPAEAPDYLAGEDGSLLVRIGDPEPGLWAVHLVGRPADGAAAPATATVCLELDGPTLVTGTVLATLPAALDADGDTFPEDLDALVTQRLSSGLPLDLSCLATGFDALLDCNPPADLELGPGCAESPGPDAAWNPAAEDLCGDCLDTDCWGGDAPCDASGR